MQDLYPKIWEAAHVVLATPVYIPLPGDMQNFINRLCPMVIPKLVYREERTRAKMRDSVAIQTFTLVATSGWWELANMDTVLRIVKELAEDASIPFAGALRRPHAAVMRNQQGVTEPGKQVLQAAMQAGKELVEHGLIQQVTLDKVSVPLITEEDYRHYLNRDVR
jgi:multimeric flavodoxin WrbA